MRELGAEPVAYGDGLADRVRALAPDGVDAAFDTSAGTRSGSPAEVLAPEGRLASIADREVLSLGGHYCLVRPDAADLAALAELAEQGVISVHVDRTFPLEQTAEAQALNAEGRTRGKIVVTVDWDDLATDLRRPSPPRTPPGRSCTPPRPAPPGPTAPAASARRPARAPAGGPPAESPATPAHCSATATSPAVLRSPPRHLPGREHGRHGARQRGTPPRQPGPLRLQPGIPLRRGASTPALPAEEHDHHHRHRDHGDRQAQQRREARHRQILAAPHRPLAAHPVVDGPQRAQHPGAQQPERHPGAQPQARSGRNWSTAKPPPISASAVRSQARKVRSLASENR